MEQGSGMKKWKNYFLNKSAKNRGDTDMVAYAKTHQGLVRKTNQDALLVDSGIFGVADGMGGHNGGETASRVAVEVIKNAVQGKQPEHRALELGIEAANRRVFDMGKKDSKLSGMGTTVTLMWEAADLVWIAHVGDSRAYLYRDGELTRQTEDHSMVAELLKNKLITPEMAENHPYKNIITRAVGIDPMVMSDIFSVEKKAGDIWLICTDGLHNMVSDAEIKEILESLKGEEAAEKLLELAIAHGGVDNISFVLRAVTEVIR